MLQTARSRVGLPGDPQRWTRRPERPRAARPVRVLDVAPSPARLIGAGLEDV
jgi:hypothetical protein